MLIVHTLPTDTHAKPRSTASVEGYRAHRLGGFTKTTFPLSRHRKFCGKRCVAALDGVFRGRCRLQQRWFSSAIQGIPLKKVCRGRNVPENGVSPFAIQVILRKMVCRGECEVKKGRERKGSGSGWDGRAVECRKETAPGLWYGSGVAEKRET